MSEENSFGNVATQPVPTGAAPAEAAGRSSKALFIVGGVAVVVLALFAYLLFGTGGGGEDDALGTVPKPPASDTAGTPTDPAADPVAEPETPPVADVEGRDPFVALVVEPPADDNLGTPTDTTTDPAPTDTTTDPAPPPNTDPTAPTVTVTLVSVKNDLVATKVGSTNYTGLAPGDTFGANFQVYAIFNASCAGLLYGDQSFALCEGKSTTLTKL